VSKTLLADIPVILQKLRNSDRIVLVIKNLTLRSMSQGTYPIGVHFFLARIGCRLGTNNSGGLAPRSIAKRDNLRRWSFGK
jgi:hypothetical protein